MLKCIESIFGRLRNVNKKHPYIAGAIDIYDDEKDKDQESINRETDTTLEEHLQTLDNHQQQLNEKYNKTEVYRKDETYNRSQINSMISPTDQEYDNYAANELTLSVYELLPAEGNPGTIYRVGNWDGTEYNPLVFTEYAWDGNDYIPIATKNIEQAHIRLSRDIPGMVELLFLSGGERTSKNYSNNINRKDNWTTTHSAMGFVFCPDDLEAVGKVDGIVWKCNKQIGATVNIYKFTIATKELELIKTFEVLDSYTDGELIPIPFDSSVNIGTGEIIGIEGPIYFANGSPEMSYQYNISGDSLTHNHADIGLVSYAVVNRSDINIILDNATGALKIVYNFN